MFHGDINKQTAKGLLALRERIKTAKIPPSKLDETLNIAVWNIREFGKKKRRVDSIHYLAEIVGQFDLVAVVELRENLEDIGRMLPILGPYWRLIYNDAGSDRGSNGERIGFLYDKRAVTFNGFAAEADPPKFKKGTEYLPIQSFWRNPYAASFRAGNFDFITVAVHVRWGEEIEARRKEIELVAKWAKGKAKANFAEDRDLILMGDFNIPKLDDPLYKALLSTGMKIPKQLRDLTWGDRVIGGTNLGMNARYDQIAHFLKDDERQIRAGGTVAFYDDDIIKDLYPGTGMTREEFTYQMSDHLPLWIQINTDNDDDQLKQIIQG